MKAQNKKQGKFLTSTSKARTLYAVAKLVLIMDATTKKMIDKLSKLRMQVNDLMREVYAIQRTLELVGIKPEEVADDVPFGWACDERYSQSQPFAQTTLVETCRRILTDNRGRRLTKSQVEYLASMGGYRFSTDDPKNSVEVTLRRLAADGFCQVEKGTGPHESQYWWEPPSEEKETS